MKSNEFPGFYMVFYMVSSESGSPSIWCLTTPVRRKGCDWLTEPSSWSREPSCDRDDMGRVWKWRPGRHQFMAHMWVVESEDRPSRLGRAIFRQTHVPFRIVVPRIAQHSKWPGHLKPILQWRSPFFSSETVRVGKESRANPSGSELDLRGVSNFQLGLKSILTTIIHSSGARLIW